MGRPTRLARSGPDTLYRMFTQLWSTPARTQLAAPDLLNVYGGRTTRDTLKCIPDTLGAREMEALNHPPNEGEMDAK